MRERQHEAEEVVGLESGFGVAHVDEAADASHRLSVASSSAGVFRLRHRVPLFPHLEELQRFIRKRP
jgi:hypothetical protein